MQKSLVFLFSFLLLANLSFGQVSGIVFKDFNANGVRDSTATYNDQARVASKVFAYDKSGTLVGTGITDLFGYYKIPNLTGDFRIEFEIPDFYFDGFSGPNYSSRSNVTFVTAPATNIDMGLYLPSDYCQDVPPIATSCYSVGSGNPSEQAVVTFSYAATGQDPSFKKMLDSPMALMGSVWGGAYQTSSRSMFFSAFMKRHAAFGTGGTGAIYLIDNATTPQNSKASLYLDLKKFGIDTGENPHQLDNYRADSIVGNKNPFDAVGKISFGDMDLSSDEKYLFIVNLKLKKVHRIFIDSPRKKGADITAADIVSWDIPNPCKPGSGEHRPFGLNVRNDKIYVGVVCDAGISRDSLDLSATVYETNPLLINAPWKIALQFPLNYRKGIATAEVPQSNQWYPWANDWSKKNTPRNFPQGKYVAYPTPMLSDMEIDVDGSLIMAFTDRFSHQVSFAGFDARGHGFDHYGTDFDPRLGGDILRANRCGPDRVWTLESNGTICPEINANVSILGNENGRGPGGGEYYFGASNDSLGHFEVAVGALGFNPGTREVVVSATDPIGIYSAGILFLNNETGDKNRAYEVISGVNDIMEGRAIPFGKASSLGDIVLLCDPGPMEVGNRVWLDTNGDGIQDPGEKGIEGVVLELANQEGKVVSTTLTNSRGEYAFNQFNTIDSVGTNRLREIGVQVKSKYTIRIVNVIGTQKQSALNRLMLTRINKGSGTKQDILDSDGSIKNNNAQIEITTSDRGQNNHTYDFGFCPSPSFSLVINKPTCDSTAWQTRKNGKILIKNIKYADKLSLVKGSNYSGKNYAQATLIASLIGDVVVDTLSNPKSDQAYTLRVYNGNDSCFTDTTFILKPNLDCVQPCPTASVLATATSCDLPNATTGKDGKIILSNLKNSVRIGYSKGVKPYKGPVYSNAMLATSLKAGSILVDTLSNPSANQTYTIRLFNLNDSCHTDVEVILPSITCKPPCDVDASVLETQTYDNKTPELIIDDYVVLDIKATNTKAGANNKFVVVCNADAKGLGGEVFNPSGTIYGQSIKVGYNKKIKANGTPVKITIRDIDSPACSIELIYTLSPELPACNVMCVPVLLTKMKK